MTLAPELAGDAGDTDQTIGFNVHDLLYRKDYSQSQLAFALNITPSVLSKKLRGRSSWSARQVAVTAAFLGTDPGRLYRQLTSPLVRPNLALIEGGAATSDPKTPLVYIAPAQLDR